VKIVHLTDLHVQTVPRARELVGKRLIGSANLYLLGRKSKFSEDAQRAAVAAALREEPDVVVITGDLTAQALDSEFAAARELLEPITRDIPTVLIPGNHDTYVREPVPGQKMRQYFSPWMGSRMPWLHRFDDVSFLALETCRAHPLSSGVTPSEQLPEAASLLKEAEGTFVFLCIHYPLRGRRGEPYGPSTRALSNAAEVEAWLSRTPGVGAILHGHEHHGFRTELQTTGGAVPILDPGASGYAYLPDKDRTAHLNVYEADGDGIHDVRRLRFDGTAFHEEPGGAYATGR